jgi:hypothetical protein
MRNWFRRGRAGETKTACPTQLANFWQILNQALWGNYLLWQIVAKPWQTDPSQSLNNNRGGAGGFACLAARRFF